MHLLELQERRCVQEVHVHGVRADAEAHEFAVVGPQAERQAFVIGDHLHAAVAGSAKLSQGVITRCSRRTLQ